MRRSWPQMPIRKYMGISITSQNKKKRNRSSETKTPMTPVSSTSREMKKPFTRWSIDFQVVMNWRLRNPLVKLLELVAGGRGVEPKQQQQGNRELGDGGDQSQTADPQVVVTSQ